ncbi:hypothetical protein IFR05_016863, partial [Cadophora sp. M221]
TAPMSTQSSLAYATSSSAALAAQTYAASLAPAPAPAAPPVVGILHPPLPANPTRAILRLHGRPAVRAAVLRPGRTFAGGRSSNLEAQLAQMTGQVVTPGCEHCQNGAGPWVLCVAAAGCLGGSCANCHYGSEGARCSLRRVAGPAAAGPSSASAGRSRRRNDSEVAPPAKRRRGAPAARPVARRRTPSQRARRFAELYRELAALHEEEAEVLEEEEETDYSVPETPRRAGSFEL